MDHLRAHVGEPEVPPAVAEREPLVVDPEQVRAIGFFTPPSPGSFSRAARARPSSRTSRTTRISMRAIATCR